MVPGAAMVAMGVEAMAQLTHALYALEGRPLPTPPCYRVRNATFSRALLLEERETQTIMITLGARAGSKDSWYEFKINSINDSNWIEHSRGLVRVEQDRRTGTHSRHTPNFRRPADISIVAHGDTLLPLTSGVPGALWYQVSPWQCIPR